MKMIMLTGWNIICNYYSDTSENFVIMWVNYYDINIYNHAYDQQTLIDHLLHQPLGKG